MLLKNIGILSMGIWRGLGRKNMEKSFLWKNMENFQRDELVGISQVKIQCNRISRVVGISNLVQTQMENIYWKHVFRNFWDY